MASLRFESFGRWGRRCHLRDCPLAKLFEFSCITSLLLPFLTPLPSTSHLLSRRRCWLFGASRGVDPSLLTLLLSSNALQPHRSYS